MALYLSGQVIFKTLFHVHNLQFLADQRKFNDRAKSTPFPYYVSAFLN